MKFSCQKELLLDAVLTTSKAAAVKTTIPALEGLLLELKGNKLSITGYNLDIGIKTTIDVQGEVDGTTVMSAKLSGDVIRKMPSGMLTIDIENNVAVISCGATEFSLACISADDYPVMPQVNPDKSFTISQKLLKNMIIQTKFAAAVSDTKPVLMGCLFEVKDNILYVVAIDGVRIAMRKEPIQFENIKFIVPLKTLDEIVHILSDEDDKNTVISIDRNQISFGVDNYIMISRLIDGDFPPYMGHITKEMASFAEVNTREMVTMLDRTMLIVNEKNKVPLRCEFGSDSISIRCETALGKINDKIAVKYTGEAAVVGFNSKYMLDAFKACDTDCVKMYVGSKVDPIIIKPMQGDEFIYLVLPMRLK